MKLNVSLDQRLALDLRQRACEAGISLSQYLGQVIVESEMRRQEALAEEGYRALSSDSLKFASSARGLAEKVWSDW